MKEKIKEKFNELFHSEGVFYTSPGRINLIGEHTDYNGGFVFPGAVDKGMIAEIKPNGTDKVRAFALDLDDYAEFGLTEEEAPAASWARYIFGVCREISKRGGEPRGFDTVFAGDVPLGAGMSSSAALESTYAFALNELFDLGIDKFELAKIGQATEHNYIGVNCGIMDQFASIFGKAGSLIRLDCRSLEYKYYPFNPVGYKLVLLDSVVKHELASSAYNKRRQSCEHVVAAIRERHPEVEFLREPPAYEIRYPEPCGVAVAHLSQAQDGDFVRVRIARSLHLRREEETSSDVRIHAAAGDVFAYWGGGYEQVGTVKYLQETQRNGNPAELYLQPDQKSWLRETAFTKADLGTFDFESSYLKVGSFDIVGNGYATARNPYAGFKTEIGGGIGQGECFYCYDDNYWSNTLNTRCRMAARFRGDAVYGACSPRVLFASDAASFAARIYAGSAQALIEGATPPQAE